MLAKFNYLFTGTFMKRVLFTMMLISSFSVHAMEEEGSWGPVQYDSARKLLTATHCLMDNSGWVVHTAVTKCLTTGYFDPAYASATQCINGWDREECRVADPSVVARLEQMIVDYELTMKAKE